MRASRRPSAAAIAFVLLSAALTVLVVVWTPWQLPFEQAARPVTAVKYFTPSQVTSSEAFHDAAKWPAWLGLVANLVAAVVVGFGGLGRRVSQWVQLRVRPWSAQAAILVVLVLAFQLVVSLPFAIWSGLVARHFGLSTQSWLGWAQDRAVSWLVATVVTALAILVGLGFARRSPGRWWIPGAVVAAVAVFGMSFAYPVVVEPLFNRFTPMQQTPLRAELLQYAARDGLDVSNVLVSDASRRTSAYNAYVSGFGASRHLVVYDNLLQDSPDSQVKVIVAHELGHARQHDVLTGTMLGAVAAAAALVGLSLLLRTRWWRARAGARSAGDPAVVPLVLSLVVLGGFVALPVQNTVSRRIEARADLHSLEVTHDPTAFILVQQRLATNNLAHLTPEPILSWWFDSHPTVLDRIAMGVAWADAHPGTR